MAFIPPNEAVISRDVEALRERFTQTQEIYREVCALLFFRYGITPTANKLYQLVRKGSMSAPAEALAKFWEDLREKSRTRIEHPDLPEELKSVAGGLVATLWTNAQAAAQDSLNIYRAETQETVRQAQADVVAAHTERDAAHQQLETITSRLEQAHAQANARHEESVIMNANYASLLAALDAAKNENLLLQKKLEESHRELNLGLDKARAMSQLAEERSRATEKRMLVDVDRERMVAINLRKKLEAQIAQSQRAADQHRQDLGALQQALGDSRQKNGVLEGSLQSVTMNLDRLSLEDKHMQAELNETKAQMMLFRRQAETLSRQLEETRRIKKKIRNTKPSGRRPRSA